MQLYVAPRIGTRIIQAVSTTVGGPIRPPSRPISQQLFPEAYENVLQGTAALGVPDRTAKAWTTVGETFLPGAVDALKKSNPIPMREDATSTLANLMRYAGGTFYKLDSTRALQTPAYDYSDYLKDERKRIKEMVQDRPNLTGPQLQEHLLNAMSKEKEKFDELRNVWQGVRQLGKSTAETTAIFKDVAPTSVYSLAPMLESGQFKSKIVSQQSFNNQKARAVKAATTEAEKAKVKKQYEEAWDMMKGYVGKQEGPTE